MESISDFWKNARERFTNPFAFAYIIAWFTYNWKITAAIFFTDVSYERLYWIVSDRLTLGWVWQWPFIKGIGIYGWPFVIAACYVIGIAFVRQVVDWLNVKFNKMGTRWQLNESKGNEVPVERFIDAKENIDKQRKVLAKAIREQDEKDIIIERRNSEITEMQRQAVENHSTTTRLNNEITGLRNMMNSLHDYAPISGAWDVRLGARKAAEYFEVNISYNIFKANNEATDSRIENLYYDERMQTVMFYRISQDDGSVHVYDLKISTEHHLEGTLNGVEIHLNRKIT